MGGVGMRAWELARALAAEHEVTLLAAGHPPVEGQLRFVEATRRAAALEAPAHDVVIAQGSVLRDLPALATAGRPLVVDFYDPFLIEGLEFRRDEAAPDRIDGWRRDLGVLGQQLAAGDFFLCASERQRHFCLGLLAAAGRLNPASYASDPTFERLLGVVPFGLPDNDPPPGEPDLPAGISADDEIVLWGGGIWNWLDPLVLVRAAAELAPSRPRLRVLFLGAQHPNPSLPRARVAAEAQALSRDLGLLDRVVFFGRDWLPYASRGAILAAARVGVSLNPPGVEAELAFRTRCLDYIWARLPMVVTAGDTIAYLVVSRELGLTVPAGDAHALAAALARMLDDGELWDRCRAAAEPVREEYRWSRVAAPLMAFCHAPRHAADRDLARTPAPVGGGVPWRRALRTLRQDGPSRFASRTWRYLRRRLA